MKKIYIILTFALLLQQAVAQNPTYQLELRNDTLVSSTVYEFDIYILRTGTVPFELATLQSMMNFDSAISSGTLTFTINSGSSELNIIQQPTNSKLSVVGNELRVTAYTPPGSGSGTIITTAPGLRVGRFRITSSLSFLNKQANITWNNSVNPFTKVNAYVTGVNTNVTDSLGHLNFLRNPSLSPLVITSSSTRPTATAGIVYLDTLIASGGTTPYLWEITGGSLPSGLTLSSQGIINGTATIAGSYNFTAQVTDNNATVVAKSFALSVDAGTATLLLFVQEPTNSIAGKIISPAVTVKLRDAYGNDSRTPNVSISMALSGSGLLSGINPRLTDSNGLATFDDLSINQSGTKELIATSTGLTPDTSIAFILNTYVIVSSAGSNGTISPLGIVNANYNSSQAFTITPNTGYHVDSLMVDGIKVDSTTSYTFNNVSTNHTIKAEFAINAYTITATVGANGSISPSGVVGVNFGGNQTFTIAPNTGYHVDSVFVDGAYVGAVTSYPFTNVITNHTISAKFAINVYTITSTAGANGSITPLGIVNVNYGGNQKFTITPNTGYHVDSLIVDGLKVDSTTSYTFNNVTANHTIRARFAINAYTITATAGANGSITPLGIVNVNYGGNRKFTITPNTGYHVDSLMVDGVKVDSTTSYTFNNVSTNHSIRATFAINAYTITATAGANGSISPSGVVGVNYGGSQTFTVTPNTGYHVDSVFVDGAYIGAVTSYLFTNVITNHTISAKFAINVYTITSTAGANGNITPLGTVNVNYNSSRAFTITPNIGYHVDSLIVDGLKVDSTTSYTFNNVTANHTIRARFAINILTITIGTTPIGLSFTVDGITYTTSQTFNWTAGVSHIITTDSIQTGITGTRNVWNSWTNAVTRLDTVAPFVNTMYTANFTTQHYLTMVANAGGSVTPSSGWVNKAQVVTLTAIPDQKYNFNVWSGTGLGSYSGWNNPGTIRMDSSISEIASFIRKPIQIVIQSNPLGRRFLYDGPSYDTPQTRTIMPGEQHYLGAVSPQSGVTNVQYVWNNWSDGGAQYHDIFPDSNTTFTVNFKTQFYLTVSSGTGGTVTPATGWQDSSQAVFIKAQRNQGFIFKGWTGTGTGSYTGPLDSVNILMSNPITETAAFGPDTMIIVATAGLNGAINPSGNVKVVYNANQSFIITPAPTYNISDVVVDGSSVGAVTSYTFNNVILNHSIIASFTKTGYTITASTGPNGTISPLGPVGVEHGSNQTFTITPSTGYHVDSLIVDGIKVDSITSYTFNNVTTNHTIRVRFAINAFIITSTAGTNGNISPLGAVNVNYGSNQKFTITPNTGYHLDSLIVDGLKVDSTTSYTFNNVTTNHTISTKFAINILSITIGTTPAGLSFIVDGITYTTTQTFNWTAGVSHFITTDSIQPGITGTRNVWNSWTNAVTRVDTVTPFVNTTYTANFTTQYYLTMVANPGGTVTPASSWQDNGKVVTITAIPDAKYHFNVWTGTGSVPGYYSGYTNPATVTMNGVYTQTASFAPDPINITIETKPSGRTFQYDGWTYNTTQTFSSSPGTTHFIYAVTPQMITSLSRYVWKNWSDGGSQGHDIQPTTDTVVTGNFGMQYMLNLVASTGGTVAPSSAFRDSGKVDTISATPNTGYHFSTWKGSGTGSYSGTNNPAIVIVNSPVNDTAIFAIDTLVITSSAGANGSISPLGTVRVTYGSNQIFNMLPNSGYHADSIFVDGIYAGTGSSYTFNNVTANHTISVKFAINQFTITASAGSNGTIEPSGVVGFSYGANQTFNITPNTGYRIDSVIVDGINQGALTSYAFTNIILNHTIRAVFAAGTLTIRVQTSPDSLLFIADGTTYTSPHVFSWTTGTNHTISAVDTQSRGIGTRYLWKSWSDGGVKSHTVVALRDTIFTSNYGAQYYLTMVTDTNGSVSPLGSWRDSGSAVVISATAKTGYQFSGWVGSGTGSYTGINNPANVTMNSPITEAASFGRFNAQVTVRTNPDTLNMLVDDVLYPSPHTFNWITGSSHTIAAVDTQSAAVGTRYVWNHWSDNGSKTHTVTFVGDTTFTSYFTTQYYLTMVANVGGAVTPQSGWYNNNQRVTITAIPESKYRFASWSGIGTGFGYYNGANNPAEVTMDGPITETANFSRKPVQIIVNTNPAGLYFIFDGQTYNTPQTITVNPGEQHYLNVNSPQDAGQGVQYRWDDWSDGGTQFHVISPDTDRTYIANFKKQFFVTVNNVPALGGYITPAANQFYDEGDTLSLLATPNARYLFTDWTGAVMSQTNPTKVIVDTSKIITANFAPSVDVTISTLPAGRKITVGDSTYNSPKLLTWLKGSNHTIGVVSPQSDTSGVRYVWTAWSDSGDTNHSVNVTTDTTFTASFATQYYLTMNSVTGGFVDPQSAWYIKGDSVIIAATPNSGYLFNRWEGIGFGSYSGTENPAKLFMNGTITESAVLSRILPPPNLTGIPNGAFDVSTSPALQWYKYPGATSYILEVSTDSAFADTTQFVFRGSALTDTSIQLSDLANLKMYYWRVSAKVGIDESRFSSVYHFTTVTATISVVTPIINWATSYIYKIKWTSNNLSGKINLLLSVDNGITFKSIRTNIPNTGDTNWTVPDTVIHQSADSCKLRIESFLNNVIYGESNIFSIVPGTLQAVVRLSTSIPYPVEPFSSTEYKLFSLPGLVDTVLIGNYPLGTQKIDWRMFTDNGNPEDYLIELTQSSFLTTGKGYWFIKKGNFDIPVYDMVMPRLDSNAALSVGLQPAWNIIGNPFDKRIPWQAILGTNGLPSSVNLVGYNASYDSSHQYLEPFKGYYFFNDSNLTSMKLPYPFGVERITKSTSDIKWKVQLTFKSDINKDPENYIGVAPVAKAGMDQLDGRKPPLFLDQGFLYFSRPEWDRKYSKFSSDFRPSIGDGQIWGFEVSNPRKSEGLIDFSGIEQIPNEYNVILINMLNNIPVDLRKQNRYTYETVSQTMQFKMIIGSDKFVQKEISSMMPETFELIQNFPNPFNNSTAMSIKLPNETYVRLDIYDPLGKQIKILANGNFAKGIHTFRWDATDGAGLTVASGVYFYRLMQNGKLVQTKKMILIK